VASGRKFLKRTKIDSSLSESEFHVGATIILFSRDLKLVDYGDQTTRELLHKVLETSIIILPPCSYADIGQILKTIENIGLTITNAKTIMIEDDLRADTEVLLGLEIGTWKSLDSEATNINKNIITVMEFRGEDTISKLLDVAFSYHKAGHVGIVASTNCEESNLYKDLFLTCRHPPTARYDEMNSTCCVVKPHAIKSRLVGSILKDILDEGFKITALQVHNLERKSASEFLDVYNSAVKEYKGMVDELCSGPVLALEIQGTVENFRQFVGPWDFSSAQNLFPDCLRAKYGNSTIQNAVHCTDLPEDNVNEVAYFFEILNSE
jgi:nucleoside-diphosphate kinase